MIPVGTLCIVIRDDNPDSLVGTACTVTEVYPPGTKAETGGIVDCLVDIPTRYRVRDTWKFWLWGKPCYFAFLFSDLMPIQPPPEMARETKRRKAKA